MKTKIIFLLLVVLPFTGYSQQLVKTYYDYNHQYVQEAYYTDSYGTKNGSYTMYSEYGGVLIQGIFKDGKKTGKWVVKNEQGKTTLEATYKDDKLNGPSIQYFEDGIKWEGNYTDDYKTGDWYSYEPYQTQGDGMYSGPKHTDVPKQALVGCEQTKILMHFKHDLDYANDPPEQHQDHYGHFINTFYPSGKKYQEGYYDSYGLLACCYEYFPNGNLAKFYKKDTMEYRGRLAIEMEREWNYPGASRDSLKMYEAMFKSQVSGQDSLQQIATIKYAADKRRDDSIAEVENRRKVMLDYQSSTIDSLCRVFKSTYVVSKQSAFLVDPTTHQPIKRTTYPHGEHLYMKSDTLFKTMYRDYNTTLDFDTRITKGKDIITLLNKLITLANGDTKDMDKEMKNAETMDDIKKVLGI